VGRHEEDNFRTAYYSVYLYTTPGGVGLSGWALIVLGAVLLRDPSRQALSGLVDIRDLGLLCLFELFPGLMALTHRWQNLHLGY
jgi:hypothetical protein